MSRRATLSVSLLAAVIAAGAFFAGRASSDEPPAGGPPGADEKMKAKMEEWMKLMTPGPQHELLKTLEGTWVGKGTWSDEGMTSTFNEDVAAKMAFGGRFLQIDSKMASEAAPGVPAMSMTSLLFIGYDNAKQKFVQAMVGEMSTSIGTSEGSYDAAAKTFTMSGVETLGPGKERKYRMVQKIVSKDEWTFEMYFTQPDGKEAKAVDGVYKRK